VHRAHRDVPIIFSRRIPGSRVIIVTITNDDPLRSRIGIREQRGIKRRAENDNKRPGIYAERQRFQARASAILEPFVRNAFERDRDK